MRQLTTITRQKNSKAAKIITYLIAFLMIINNGTVYTHIEGINHFDVVTTYAPVLLLMILLLMHRTVSRRSLIVGIELITYLGLYAIISSSNMKMALPEIVLVFVFLIYFLTLEMEGTPRLLIAYRDIIFVVAFVSLFFWFFGSILGIVPNTGTVISNWGLMGTGMTKQLKSYFGIYFELDRTYIFGTFITSNRAIFVERAFASFSFCIGWIYELLLEKNKSRLKLTVFSLAMISTLSMTGLIVTVITFVLYYIFNGTNRRIIRIFKFLLVPLVIAVATYIIYYLLQTKMSMGHSYSSRRSDFSNGIEAWRQSILYGYGYGNNSYIHQTFKTGYSNSVTAVLSQGGIMLAILYLISFGRGLVGGFKTQDINKSLFVIVLLVILSFTAVAFTNTVIYLMIYLYYGISRQIRL